MSATELVMWWEWRLESWMLRVLRMRVLRMTRSSYFHQSSQSQVKQYHKHMHQERSIAEHRCRGCWLWSHSGQMIEHHHMSRCSARCSHSQWRACGTNGASGRKPRRCWSHPRRQCSRDHTSRLATFDFRTRGRRSQSHQLRSRHASDQPNL